MNEVLYDKVDHSVFVSGMSCIGKTHLLKRWCSRLQLELVQFDLIRNKQLPRGSVSDKNTDFGFDFIGFPLNANEWSCLIQSGDRYLDFHAWQAKHFQDHIIELINSTQHTVVEISPFLLHFLRISKPVILTTVDSTLHVERIVSKLGCSNNDAQTIQSILSSYFALIEKSFTTSKVTYLNLLPSKLATMYGSA